MAMGPPPKKIRAKARAAAARGNSYPGRSGDPMSPLCKWTFQMATTRSMQTARAAGRVKNPTRISKPAEKFGEGRNVTQPCRQAQAGDDLSVVVQASKNFVITVSDHDGAQGQAHDQKSKRLQAIEIAQGVPPERRNRLPQPSASRARSREIEKTIAPHSRIFDNVAPPQDAIELGDLPHRLPAGLLLGPWKKIGTSLARFGSRHVCASGSRVKSLSLGVCDEFQMKNESLCGSMFCSLFMLRFRRSSRPSTKPRAPAVRCGARMPARPVIPPRARRQPYQHRKSYEHGEPHARRATHATTVTRRTTTHTTTTTPAPPRTGHGTTARPRNHNHAGHGTVARDTGTTTSRTGTTTHAGGTTTHGGTTTLAT